MYDREEMGAAQEALGTLAGALPEPLVLLGGWAVQTARAASRGSAKKTQSAGVYEPK